MTVTMKSCASVILMVTILTDGSSSIEAAGEGARATRHAFAAALAKISEGMTAAEVYRSLGAPDDVRTRNEPGALKISDASEAWGYGVNRHRGFPVLGEIQFDSDGRVVRVAGGQGEPPPAGAITETELTGLLRLIDTAPPLNGEIYDPRLIITIVNALQPLGKEKAIGVIREYLRVSDRHADARQGLYLVVRALFDVPEEPGYMPDIREGVPIPLEPRDGRLVPRFPLHIVMDVPLLLVSGYERAGQSLGVEPQIDYFQKHGTLRSRPLRPAPKPLHLMLSIQDMPKWYSASDQHDEITFRLLLMGELLRLCASVFPVRLDEDAGAYYEAGGGAKLTRRWLGIIEQCREDPVRWDPEKSDYVRVADGQ